MKILFAQVDWMKYYVGEGDEEKITPFCGYNFQNTNGYYYGALQQLVEIPLEKIEEGKATDDQLEDVLVVWTGCNKKGEQVIIGWYKHATVYRRTVKKLTLDSERLEMCYNISTAAENGLLLPMEERSYVVTPRVEAFWIEEDKLVASTIAAYIHHYAGDQMNLVLKDKDINRAIVIPMDYEQCFRKADEFLAKDLYAKAIKCFNRAIEEEPDETLGYECKGSVFLSLKMYDLALVMYEKVVSLDADNELAYYCLGLLNGLKENYVKALEYYTYYLEKRSEDMLALAEKALVLYHLGQREDAYATLLIAAKREPENRMFQELIKLLEGK